MRPNKWNKNKALEEAKKYKTRTEFQLHCSGGYNFARKNGFLDECYKGMLQLKKIKNFWNPTTITLEMHKFKTLKEFRSNSPSAYLASRRIDFIEEVLAFYKYQKRKWSKETILNEILKHQTLKSFRFSNSGVYQKAIKLKKEDHKIKKAMENLKKQKA